MKIIPHSMQNPASLLRSVPLILILSCVAVAQEQSQYDHGTPPQHAAGLSAIGSYVSSDLGTVNLSNGSLNFKIPLGDVGGRGFSLPLTLNYSNKVWSASLSSDFDTDTPAPGHSYPVAFAVYDDPAAAVDLYQRVAPGWTMGAVPTLRVRGSGIFSAHNSSTGCDEFTQALTKLTLILPDKGEIELRDDATDGEPLGTGYYNQCRWMDGNRGQRWHATDGSGTVFISDVNNGVVNGDLNGTVITGDGTRYRIVDTAPYSTPSVFLQEFGRAASVTDRNGNKLNIGYSSTVSTSSVQYTDQLGRTTRIDYNTADPVTGEPLAVLVTVLGYGQNRYYKIKTGTMNQHYRSGINPTLPVINGDNDPLGYGYGYPGPHTSLFPNSYGSSKEFIDTQAVLTQLVLPDGRSLTFNYNEYGEVAEVVMPTGGKVQYDYAYVSTLPSGNSAHWEVHPDPPRIASDVHEIDRAVVARRTYADGANLESRWSYNYAATIGGDSNGSTASGAYTDVQARAPDNTLVLNQRHWFMNGGRFLLQTGGTGYSLWSTGIERRTETRNAVDTVTTASEEDWSQRAPVSWPWSNWTAQQIANDNRVNESRKILDDGSTAKVDTFYQQNVKYNNPTEVQEFDFDQALKRRSMTLYADSTNLVNGLDYTADSIHLLHLPLATTVFDNGGNQKAQSVNEYDNYVDDANHNHQPLQDYGLVIQHDSSYGASYTTRGNLTGSGRWLNLTNSFIYSYPRYDDLGNVVSAKDAKGNIASISFADDFGNGSNPGGGTGGAFGPTYALPTLITSPPPNPGDPVQTARSQYDFNTGLVTGFRDRNGTITQTLYNDPFDRPTQVKAALGIDGVESHAVMYYAPTSTPFGISLTNNDVLTARDQNSLGDAMLRSWTHTDGFGRTIETWSRDPQGDDKVATIYDALGRVSKQSNPYRPSLSETPVFSTSAYDLMGRVTSVTTPDNAVVTTIYSGNTVTVTDQSGKQRKSVSDALGRLIQVYEAPNDSNYNYLTSYAYDTLDNLTTVTQGSQPQRSFVYDSLKRLSSASNPESGTVSYQYDNNGNLIQKTDPRLLADNQTHVTISYDYDALNRVKTRTYNDGTAPNFTDRTPAVTYLYDSVSGYGKGRLASVSSSVSTYIYTGYDAMGRALGRTQTVGSQNYSLGYTYDLAGHVLTQTYPSVHTVTNAYDSAGRTNSVTGNLGDSTSRTYATGISYSPFGGIAREQYGTAIALYHKTFYNIRGQMFDTRLSSVNDTWDWNRGRLIWYYSSNHVWGASGTDNNGNVLFAENWVPPPNATLDQAQTLTQDNYNYDALNRLSAVNESSLDIAAGGSWVSQFAQVYSYDRYGNRTIDQTNTWGTGIPKPNFAVNTTNNRLGVPNGLTGTMSYDAAGNLTADTYNAAAVTRAYDAENRMTAETQASSYVAGTYGYDGDGRRVKRIVGSTETWQVYGLGGELLAEYAANADYSLPQKEYGYRNGQLLVTATVTTGWGSAPTLNDNPLSAGQTTVQARHITELRTAINSLRSHMSLSAYSWQYSATTSDYISANPILEMRTALDQALGAPSGGYSAGLAQGQPVKAIHIQELRDRILAAWSSGNSVDLRWLVTDQLGTPRMIADLSGSLSGVSRHDYLPFGEELFGGQPGAPGAGGRLTTQGYSGGDSVRQKFTQKERDNETGLDYFLARYYSSTQGRFTSPDEFTGGPDELYTFAEDASNNPTFYANLGNPQSLNKYQYAFNNPLRYVDPDGHDPLDPPQNPTCPCTMTPAQQEQMKKDIEKGLDWVAGVTGITALADWLRTNGPAVGKAILDHGGKSAMQQDMEDLRMMRGDKSASSQQGQQSQQGQSNTASPNPNDPNKKPIFGERGTQTTSKPMGSGKGWRVDVENPNPGQRAGQIHYQSGNTKLLYDPKTNSFVGASKTLNRQLMNNAQVQRAIKKGMKVLGEN